MKKLVILKGGNSLEREISLKSCDNILENIKNDLYDLKVIEVSKDKQNLDWIKHITDFKPDIIFSTLHGGIGEDGTIQGFFDTLSLKYVGSKALSSGICIDKKLSKQIMEFNKIPVLPDIFLNRFEDIAIYTNEIDEMSFPLIVKPNKGGASIGIRLVYNKEMLLDAIDNVKKLDDDVLIEKYVGGQEVTCCVIQKDKQLFVLPLLDIKNKKGIFDFHSKYKEDGNVSFSKLPLFIQTMIKEVAKKTFKVLKCEGYANIDLIVKEEEIYVLEVNTIPGMTKNSLLPKAIEIEGIKFSDFFDDLIKQALLH